MIGQVQRLTLDDLPDCCALAQSRDWSREEHKWRLLVDLGTAYGLRDDDGELVGTTILTRYGSTLAAISMVLVAARLEGRGLGRRMMTHAMAEAGDATVFLNATDLGRPLYEKLDFVAVGTTYMQVGSFAATGGPAASRLAHPADLAAVAALDAEVNGVARSDLLERLPAFAEQLRVIDRDGTITGYAGAWRNDDHLVIGPVIAESADDARVLITDIASSAHGRVRLDLDDRNPELREWAAGRGLESRFETAVMVHGDRPLPGDRSRWFVPLMQALG